MDCEATITGDDWRRALASARVRRAGMKQRINANMNQIQAIEHEIRAVLEKHGVQVISFKSEINAPEDTWERDNRNRFSPEEIRTARRLEIKIEGDLTQFI